MVLVLSNFVGSGLSDLGSGIIILCRIYGIRPVEEPIMKASSFQFGGCRYASIQLPVPTYMFTEPTYNLSILRTM